MTDKKYLSMPEAMRYTGLCRNTVKKYLHEGHFSGRQINSRGDWRVDRESIDAWFQDEYEQEAVEILQSL